MGAAERSVSAVDEKSGRCGVDGVELDEQLSEIFCVRDVIWLLTAPADSPDRAGHAWNDGDIGSVCVPGIRLIGGAE
jgi:hypothetical protein